MADDLSKPLLGTGRRRKGPGPAAIALTVLAAVLAGIAIWVMIDTAPKFSAAEDDLAANAAADADTANGEVVIRAAEDQASGVVITTPDGVQLNGDAPATPAPEAVALSAAPDPALLEPGPYGPIPKVGADGVRPFDAYARPATALQ